MLKNDFLLVFPEIILSIFAILILMIGVFFFKKKSSEILFWIATFFMGLVTLFFYFTAELSYHGFNNSLKFDAYGSFFKSIIFASAAIVLGLSVDYLKKLNILSYEYPVLMIFSIVGMSIMVSSTDMLVLYMGIELQSLALYIMSSYRRDSIKSTEAGLKYFVLGALSSGILLYGVSLIYGFTGTTNFQLISLSLKEEGMPLGVLFGLTFILAGMAFKVSAVPFHMWTPDVYEGAPTTVTAFFASAPKVAALAMLGRFLFEAFESEFNDWRQILIFLSFLSMFLGSIAAIVQTNIKRLMAFSSISHMGFALMGLAAGSEVGLNAVLIYSFLYVIMNIGVFTFIINMEKDGVLIADISSLSLYSKVDPVKSLFLSVLILSLAGIPPFVGFLGKVYIFSAAIDSGLFWLASAGAISSVIGAYYYIRIVYLIYFGKQTEPLTGVMPRFHWVILSISSISVVLGTFNLLGIQSFADIAALSLVQ